MTLQPFQYTLVSTKRVRKRLGLDLKAAVEGSDAYEEYIKLYTQVKGRPDLQKGVLRITL